MLFSGGTTAPVTFAAFPALTINSLTISAAVQFKPSFGLQSLGLHGSVSVAGVTATGGFEYEPGNKAVGFKATLSTLDLQVRAPQWHLCSCGMHAFMTVELMHGCHNICSGQDFCRGRCAVSIVIKVPRPKRSPTFTIYMFASAGCRRCLMACTQEWTLATSMCP